MNGDLCTSAPASGPVWHCECELCGTDAAGALAYFEMAFGEPHHAAAASEGIADALGFCSRHGRDLLARTPHRIAVARVFEGVVPLVLPLLAQSRFGDERFQQVYFSAPDACPACAYEHRAVGRHAARLCRQHFSAGEPGDGQDLPLCNSHFQVLVRRLKPERRMPALARHAQALDQAAGAVENLLAGGVPGQAGLADLPSLAHALGICACPPNAVPDVPGSSLVEALQVCDDFEQALAWRGACSVCMEVERARQRWMTAVPLAVTHHLDDWLFLPTCPEHVSAIAGLGNTAVTAAVAAHALRVAGEHAHQQLRILVRAAESEAEQAAARIVGWGRRPRRRKSDPPKPPAPKIARCAACERLAIAELHATGRLLRLLNRDKQRQTFEAGYGLCMKHHAQAYLLAPKGEVRAVLAADQKHRLSGLMLWLKQEKSSFTHNQADNAPNAEYVLALRRFCGFG